MTRSCVWGAALSAALMLGSAAAGAAEPTAVDKLRARALLDEGDKKMERKEYPGALKAYLAADAIMNVPTTGIEVARAQAALGQLVEARDTALRASRIPVGKKDPAPFTKARAEAGALASELTARIPSLKVTVTGLPAGTAPRVTIDGAIVAEGALSSPREVNPGAHVVAASAASFDDAKQTVTVAERQQERVTLTLVAARSAGPPSSTPSTSPAQPPVEVAPPPSRGVSPLVWIGFGIGVAGLGTGAVTGGLSLSKASSAKEHCDTQNRCEPVAQGDIDASKTFAIVSDIGFGVGAAGVVLGVVGLFLRPSPPASQATVFVTPTAGGAAAGYAARF